MLNALYLTAVVQAHGGEWLLVAFHLGVVAFGLVLVGLGGGWFGVVARVRPSDDALPKLSPAKGVA